MWHRHTKTPKPLTSTSFKERRRRHQDRDQGDRRCEGELHPDRLMWEPKNRQGDETQALAGSTEEEAAQKTPRGHGDGFGVESQGQTVHLISCRPSIFWWEVRNKEPGLRAHRPPLGQNRKVRGPHAPNLESVSLKTKIPSDDSFGSMGHK